MIRHNISCNICHLPIDYYPSYGADCICLIQKGPAGMEGSVLVTDEYRSVAEHTDIHICRQCEKGLRSFFTNSSAKQA